MGPRIDLNPDELALIRELFRIRFENNWTNSEVARQFEQRTSRSISYQTLINRYNNLGRNQVPVHEAPRTTREEPIETNFAEQNMSLENVVSIDEPRDSQSEQNIADVTVEIEQNMSILDVEDSNSNVATELIVEDNFNPIANPLIEITNVNTNGIIPTNVNRGRPRGRPRGSRRGRLTLQREEERNYEGHINRVTNETPQARQSRLERGLRNIRNHRANETQAERNERLQVEANRTRENIAAEEQQTEIARVAMQNQRQRERRTNETNDEQLNRLARTAQRNRNNRANETEEQRERRLQYQRDYRRRIADAETEQERLERLGLVHVRARQARFNLPTYRLWYRSNRPVDPQDNQGAPDQICPHCGAKYWRNEVNSTGVYTKCCERNKIVIPRFTQAHPTLVRLLGRDNQNPMDIEIRKNFINNIREYNSTFSMAAVLTNFDRADMDNHFNDIHRRNARGRPMPYLYKIHGRIYYKIAPMFNGIEGNQNLRAVQCLMMDSDQAILEAMETNFPLNVMLEANRLLRGTIQLLHRMLLDSNQLVQFFLTNREILQRQNREDPLTLRCWMTRNVPLNNTVPLNQQGQRQLATAPVHGEIAAVFSDFDGLPPEGTILYAQARELGMPLIGILAQRINNILSQIDQRNPNCDPLCYPIIYVFGEAGYDERIQHNQAVLTRYSRVTMKEFYKFRFHFRDLTIELMFSMGKLFQEYIVHCWVKIEKNNLNYLRRNQANLRIHEYAGIMDHLNNPNADGVIGRAFILPSTFEGSDRAMRKHFYDGMELVGRFGKAHLFITFTANPKWPEIQNELQPGQSYLSRPDVCSRVYNLKFNEFWKDLVKDFKLGVVDAWLKTKEYQQRGLPHHHGLLWMAEQDQPTIPEIIDELISAEIPDPEEDPELYELVATKMMHGPCRPNSPCMQKYGNRCSKGFPKNFSETTIIRDNNYPIYKRPNNGRFVMVNGVALDNRYVIEYPPEALRKFCCHINIQVVGFLASLKYVLKYVCKGNDRVNVVTHGLNNVAPFANQGQNREELAEALRANPPQHDENNENQNEIVENDNYDVQVNRDVDPVFRNASQEEQEAGDVRVDPVVPVVQEETYDEIRAYEEKRYVSSIEAFDRIMGFPRIEMSHSIHVLKVHLPGRQNIVFREAGIQNLANNVEPVTELIDFFRLNGRDVYARQFLYKDIVNHYVFDPTNKEWTRRVNDGSRVIGRIPFISSSLNEIFFLKLLLLHVRGATSYEHLRTVNDVVWPTFEAAAMALNLVENNVQWHTTMEELAATEMPYRLRFLFVTILIHNNPVNPNGLALWDNFQDALSEDYREDDADTRTQKALGHIRYLLNGHGRTLADFNLPEPDERGLNWRHVAIPVNFEDMNPEQHSTIAMQLEATLNEQQRTVVDTIVEAVLSNDPTTNKSYFVDGPGGTGKTYVINLLYHRLRQLNYRMIPTAFTGIAAALLIGGGQTLHSKFRIPIPTDLNSVSRIQADSEQAQTLRECKLFIIDEASQVSRAMLECIDRLLRDLMRQPNVPFGGKVMLLTGDFRQCAPVSDNQNIEASVNMCIKRSDLWTHFRQMALQENVRADPNEIEFKEWLMEVGDGRSRVYDNHNLIRLPDRVVCNGNLVNEIFGEGELRLEENNRFKNAILCPTNKDALEINETILARSRAPNRELLSNTQMLDRETDQVVEEHDDPVEEVLRRTPHGFPPHILNLKVGALVMLLKNWSLADGLCNGTRLTVRQINNHSVRCSVLNGPLQGHEYVFCRTEFRSPQTEAGTRIRRFQFPFRLAFAMTINKSQGQTFNRVGLLLRTPVFSHGQLYVALSRVRNFDSIRILVATHERGRNRQGQLEGLDRDGGVYTKNVVFRDLLQ